MAEITFANYNLKSQKKSVDILYVEDRVWNYFGLGLGLIDI